ncbi:hypothetical protein G7051_03830 [Dysgonomonas sp. HDW5B]|uniref:hypothetical protein n=1 Tax=Dysgonomonas sp. HDW5B TaxID=2714927 RepID=UPI00140BB601|nr:hypothetical protein [Dysgonomonas sp. HDW5B]QIK53523.1 hypothetical protein G7051_03830 [Dysgonomonas sp. HDW5B]
MKCTVIFFMTLIPLIGNCKKVIETPTNSKDSVKTSYSLQESVKKTRSGLYPSSAKIRQDQLLPDSIIKSSLYIYIEKRMREELGINENTDDSEFPIIYIDNRISFLKDINELKYSQAKTITILSKNDSPTVLYGTSALHGIIRIETK